MLLAINKPHLLCSKEYLEEMYRVSTVGSSGNGSMAGSTVWGNNCIWEMVVFAQSVMFLKVNLFLGTFLCEYT